MNHLIAIIYQKTTHKTILKLRTKLEFPYYLSTPLRSLNRADIDLSFAVYKYIELEGDYGRGVSNWNE